MGNLLQALGLGCCRHGGLVVDQKDLQLGQEKILRVCIKTWVSAITSLRTRTSYVNL